MMKRTLITQELVNSMENLRIQDRSYSEIASELNLSYNTIKRHLIPGYIECCRKIRKERNRSSRVHTTIYGVDKLHKVVKRPRLDHCEMCDRKISRLDWHHWDDDHLEWGLWLCLGCHKLVGAIEEGLSEKYLSLKKEIEIASQTL